MTADFESDERAPSEPASKTHRHFTHLDAIRLIVVPAILGLLVGALAGVTIVKQRISEYSATSTFALLPQSTTSGGVDTGQLALLTPVYAALVNDSITQSMVEHGLGHAPAPVVSQTYPDSALVFTVTATGDSALGAYETARAYEAAIEKRAGQGDLVSSKAVRVQVVTSATLPTSPTGLSSVVLLGAANAGGFFIGLGVGLLLMRRRSARRATQTE